MTPTRWRLDGRILYAFLTMRNDGPSLSQTGGSKIRFYIEVESHVGVI